MKTIRFGSRGNEVRLLQEKLGIAADGIFGRQTLGAVREFQGNHGLVMDGVVGPRTWGAVLNKPKPNSDELHSKIREIISANSEKLTTKLNNKNDKIVTFDPEEHLIVVAVRGFYEMGRVGNDRGIYDDAHFVYTPNDIKTYRGNTDPSGFRRGSGFGSGKGMASLNPGVWFYGPGPHRGRPSFRQCCPFGVTRDGSPPYQDFGWFGINWHSGNDSTTSSLGCQTNRPQDFESLRNYIYSQLVICDNPFLCHDWAKNFNDSVRAFPYILISEENFNAEIFSA